MQQVFKLIWSAPDHRHGTTQGDANSHASRHAGEVDRANLRRRRGHLLNRLLGFLPRDPRRDGTRQDHRPDFALDAKVPHHASGGDAPVEHPVVAG